MHQTFYIDIDEEITSVIDRIRHARAKEIIMVVPKRALLIQSIVNLRILKKEVEESGFQLMMVTQDKLGKILIEKAGIFVQQKIDNIADEEINLQEDKNKKVSLEKENDEIETGEDGSRLKNIGSMSYFNEENSVKDKKINLGKAKKGPISLKNKDEKEELLNKELVTGIGRDMRKTQTKEKMDIPKREVPPVRQHIRATKEPSRQDRKIENFFYQPNSPESRPKKIEKDNPEDYNLSIKIYKWFWVFGIVSAIVFLGIVSYLFIPKVDLVITVKTDVKSIDSEVTGKIGVDKIDYDNRIIPARVVEVSHEITEKIDATGSKSISNQKARGMVTIYNEYSTSSQPLVATTRFLTQDGKLFRLVKGVTVPGMTKEGEKGFIEAEVVADQSGEEYNIEPAQFTVPGFQNSGNDKYTKFYAKSTAVMTGGGNGTGQSNFITASDVSSARAKVLSMLEDAMKQKIKETSGEDTVILDGAIKKDEAVYKLSNSEGDVADSFQITAEIKTKAIIVNQKELNDIVAHMIVTSENGELDIDQNSISLDFGKPNVDFDAGTMDIKFRGTGKINPKLDLLVIKEEILGKNEDDLGEYLSTFKEVEKAEIDYWPSFMNSRIPFRESQVDITLDKQ